MNTMRIENVETEVNEETREEVSKTSLYVLAGLTALVGVWGFACLASGLAQLGVASAVKGFIIAVIGG